MMLSAGTNPYQYGQMGPGGGSVPAWVMRSGQFAPFSAMNPRHDIEPQWVQDATQIPVGQVAPAAPTQTVGPGTTMPMPAPTAGYFGEFGVPGFQMISKQLYLPVAAIGAVSGAVAGGAFGLRRVRAAGLGALVGAAIGTIGTWLVLKSVPQKDLAI